MCRCGKRPGQMARHMWMPLQLPASQPASHSPCAQRPAICRLRRCACMRTSRAAHILPALSCPALPSRLPMARCAAPLAPFSILQSIIYRCPLLINILFTFCSVVIEVVGSSPGMPKPFSGHEPVHASASTGQALGLMSEWLNGGKLTDVHMCLIGCRWGGCADAACPP